MSQSRGAGVRAHRGLGVHPIVEDGLREIAEVEKSDGWTPSADEIESV